MKLSHFVPFLFLVPFILRCGADPTVVQQNIALKLKLPAALSKSSGKYLAFLKRVEFLEVVAVTEGGETYEGAFPPFKWEALFIPPFPFPKTKSDKLKIKIKVWDKELDGYRRKKPVLSGEKEISSDLFETGSREIPITLKQNLEIPLD